LTTQTKNIHNANKKVEMADEKELIEQCFHCGYENKVIVDLLRCQHGIQISLSTLKRRLQDYDLNRRGLNVDENRLRQLIQSEISGPGQLGYRAVWHSLRLCHNIHVQRKDVARILQELDTKVTLQRRSQRLQRRRYISFGPNFCWHADGINIYYFKIEILFETNNLYAPWAKCFV
jgi:hypothetical protein